MRRNLCKSFGCGIRWKFRNCENRLHLLIGFGLRFVDLLHDLADPWIRFKPSQSNLRFKSNPPVPKTASAYLRENADEPSMLQSSRCFDRRIPFHEVA